MNLQSIKDIGIMKKIGFKHVGNRTCETCQSTVPIYKKGDNQASVCMVCENKKIKDEQTKLFKESQNRKFQSMIDDVEEIPSELKNATFQSYKPMTDIQKQAKQTLTNFANNKTDETTMLLLGEVGLGKSHLAVSVASHMRSQGKATLFIDSPSLMDLIRSTFDKRSTLTKETILETIINAELLVLDDIGAEYTKRDASGFESFVSDVLFQIVNSRQEKKNIYTTNYTGEELIEKYGRVTAKRILSRMRNNSKVIKLDGDDQRPNSF